MFDDANTFGFRPERLTSAREARRMTQAGLAKQIGRSAASLVAYEAGKSAPKPDVLVQMAEVLGRPIHFFFRKPGTQSQVAEAHWRVRQKASMRLRHQITALASDIAEVVTLLDSHFALPPFEITVPAGAHAMTPEDLAKACRAEWRLGTGPLPNVVEFLESKGIIVVELVVDYGSTVPADGFTIWTEGLTGRRPVVFLVIRRNEPAGANCRRRQTALHELKHILTDADVSFGTADIERDATSFASAMLLPQAWVAEFPRFFSIQYLQQLKQRWKASMKAMAHRAAELQLIGAGMATRYYIEIKNTWPDGEPLEPPPERPSILSSALAESPGVVGFVSDELGIPAAALKTLATTGRYGPTEVT